jgi:hypothetical protein
MACDTQPGYKRNAGHGKTRPAKNSGESKKKRYKEIVLSKTDF